ncbi:hypothetical protein N9N67_05205 [Bacteriovoracaceae bacterium]|nr:hypothetical protein [Bacteriovoracaceae bacterium]
MNFFRYLLFISILGSTGLSAGEDTSAFGLGFGGFTPHFTKTKKNYCNQWNNTGIIANRSYYSRFQIRGVGVTYINGHDSICSQIEGLIFHSVFSSSESFDFSMVIGGYTYDPRNWERYKEKTPEGIDAPSPVSVEAFGRMVVPVLALGVDVHMIRRDTWSLKLVNILTPIITNHSLMIEWRF